MKKIDKACNNIRVSLRGRVISIINQQLKRDNKAQRWMNDSLCKLPVLQI